MDTDPVAFADAVPEHDLGRAIDGPVELVPGQPPGVLPHERPLVGSVDDGRALAVLRHVATEAVGPRVAGPPAVGEELLDGLRTEEPHLGAPQTRTAWSGLSAVSHPAMAEPGAQVEWVPLLIRSGSLIRATGPAVTSWAS